MYGNWLVIWLIAAIVFALIEIVTMQLFGVCLAVGSVGALVACSLGQPLWIQLLVFAVLCTILLLLTRPVANRLQKKKLERTNADRLIGCDAMVTESIDNAQPSGAVKISGITWTARSTDGSKIKAGTHVTIERIEGSKLFVAKH